MTILGLISNKDITLNYSVFEFVCQQLPRIQVTKVNVIPSGLLSHRLC